MRKLSLVTLIAICGGIVVAGCNPPEPDEAALHKALGGPPQRPGAHKGVGQAKMEAAQKAAATGAATTGQ